MRVAEISIADKRYKRGKTKGVNERVLMCPLNKIRTKFLFNRHNVAICHLSSRQNLEN